MLTARDIVCFSNDWDGDPLSKTHIMRILAKRNRVLWVNSLGNRTPRANAADAAKIVKKLRAAVGGLREVEPNLHVLAPVYVPAYGSEAVRSLNRTLLRAQVRLAMRKLGMRRPISWSFLPSAAPVAGTLGEERVIYHVVDEFSAFSDASAHVAELERRILRRAELVIASSEKLLESKRKVNPNAVLVRHGVDHAHFAKALDPAVKVPDDLARLPGPVIGFFGLVADWIDLELVRAVADRYPHASVVLLGKVTTSTTALDGAKNVHFLGRKPYQDLPAYCKGFDVAITPFRLNELALAANPLKAREYVAAGLPNVCTDLPELRAIPGCTVARSHDAFVAEVGRWLGRGGPDPARSALVEAEGWEAKVEEICGHLAALDRRRVPEVASVAAPSRRPARGTMRTDVNAAAALDAAVLAREGALETMTRRWSALAYLSAVGFIALLYANPMYWWPWVERLRLAFVVMAVGAVATFAHRLTSGERLRLGGRGAALLFAYLAFVPMSLLWTVDRPQTLRATVDVAKLFVVYATILNALHTRSRLRTFLLVAALASLGPALGGVWTWSVGEGLVEGFRTRWRGLYADPNRLAMSLTAVLPFALYGVYVARKRWHKAVFAGVVAAQIAAVVLTHSRSGAVAAGVAVLAFVMRGRRGTARGVLLAGAIVLGVVAFAPSTFWKRQATIADYAEDASVAGRRAAWTVLGVIFEERPLGGVGAGAFLTSWDRYAPLEAGGHRYVAHNIFMEIAGELGLVAFAFFAAWVAWLLRRTWVAGRDPLVGLEARAIAAGLMGYLVCEMANGYSLSWFLYFLFGSAAAAIRLSEMRAAMTSYDGLRMSEGQNA